MSIGFSGIQGVEKATVAKIRGARPSVATLLCTIQGSQPPSIGQLLIADGGFQEIWQDAAIVAANRRHLGKSKGHRISVQVADRRWRWSQKTISGVYNTRLDDGKVSETNKKSVQELVNIIFSALGELADTSALPGDLYPPVTWVAKPCSEALDEITKSVGCGIVLDYATNTARAYVRGQGAAIPANGREVEPFVTMTNGPAPSSLRLDGGAILVQSKIKLQAIAIDKDGPFKKVDDVGYKPTAGWGNEWPGDFAGVSDEGDRALARQSMWRYFALKEFADGTLSIPELPNVQISKPSQLLPLRERLLEADKDQNDIQRQNLPYIEGDFWYKADDGSNSDHKRYPGKFRVLWDLGIVIFDTPVFKITDGDIAEPELFLTVAHYVRDATTDGLVYYSWQRMLGPGNNEIAEARPEVFKTVIQQYDKTSRTGAITNFQEADTEANKYLDAMQRKYAPVEPPTAMQYRGIVLQQLDGAIAQVKHTLSGGELQTVISRNYEDDVHTPSERLREVLP
jgi:hypothetical protein